MTISRTVYGNGNQDAFGALVLLAAPPQMKSTLLLTSFRAKGEGQKVEIAMRLREETAVAVKWIAERLGMGAPGYVNHLLYRASES